DEKNRDALLSEIVREKIIPHVFPGARRAIEFHKKRNDLIVIVTSTADFLARHIARQVGIDHVIATSIECVDGKVTGKIVGDPAYKELKVTKIRQFVEQNDLSIEDSYAYGDSVNDIPMLLLCTHKIAVNPNEKLLNDPLINQFECVDWSV
ncbi:MAG: HAD family hydrolase, partial [Succinivibrio sp.]